MLYKELSLRIILTGDTIYFSLVIENVFSALNNEGSLLLENDNFIEVECIFTHMDNLP